MHGLAGRSAVHGPCSMLAWRMASRLMHGIGQLGVYDAVGIGDGTELVFRLQDDQDVGVQKRPLLALDGIEDSSHPAQRPAGAQVSDQGAQLLAENTTTSGRRSTRCRGPRLSVSSSQRGLP